MNPDLVTRLALYFGAEPSRPGILARLALGHPGPRDPDLALELRERLAAELRPDGSVRGAALPTVWHVHQLLDLGEPSDSRPIRTATRWLGALQSRSGAFGEGCDKQRHARRACEHFLVGFFSPAPPQQRLTPVTLPNGKLFRAEPAARFALSALALRAMVRAGESSQPPVRRHLESLARFAEQWSAWSRALAPDAIVAGMHALAEAGPPWSDAIHRLLPVVVERQGPEGGWSEADLFPMLDMLLGVGSSEALAVVRRALPALAARQRSDGSFGATAQQERALIGLRAALGAGREP